MRGLYPPCKSRSCIIILSGTERRSTTMAYKITDACVSCGTCGDACPAGAISQGDSQYVIDEGSCMSCGACAGACPTGAIEEG